MIIFLPNLGMGASPAGEGDGGSVTYYVRRRSRVRWQPYIGAMLAVLRW